MKNYWISCRKKKAVAQEIMNYFNGKSYDTQEELWYEIYRVGQSKGIGISENFLIVVSMGLSGCYVHGIRLKPSYIKP